MPRRWSILLQTIIPEAEDIAALVMAYRRCGKKKEALKAVQVGWRPVFEGTDCRKDPLVITQMVLAEDDLQRAIEIINEAWADSNWMTWSWPEPPMVQFLLAKTAYQAGVFPTALQAVQQALTCLAGRSGLASLCSSHPLEAEHTQPAAGVGGSDRPSGAGGQPGTGKGRISPGFGADLPGKWPGHECDPVFGTGQPVGTGKYRGLVGAGEGAISGG